MHDMKSDWKRWSRTERISATTFVLVALAICGSSVFGELAGVWQPETAFPHGASAVERSTTHGTDGPR